MAKRPATKNPDPEEIVNEIIDEFFHRGEANPSPELKDWLAEKVNWSKTQFRQHYRARYKEITGRDDDPDDLPDPSMG